MKGWVASALLVLLVIVLAMIGMELIRSDCNARGGSFEYAPAYKTYICVGAEEKR